ncbi:P-loop containing nucleoside triphosphate hydrolase protein [Xylaria venustula]|nr:P-loop containing nucleoside triphosphate hydrolase protein [Xylaria venustula]
MARHMDVVNPGRVLPPSFKPRIPQIELPQLPRHCAPNGLASDDSPLPDKVDIRSIICAIQQGETVDAVEKHLTYYDQLDAENLQARINEKVEGLPAIFYIVHTDDVQMIRSWVKYGGNPAAVYEPTQFPLLAYAILHRRDARTVQQATCTVETLLMLGASPFVVPRAFYTPFSRKLPESGPTAAELTDSVREGQSWCAPFLGRGLVLALNITQRYRLWQASKIGTPSCRQKFVASRSKAESVFGLQYMIVGQSLAVEAIKSRLIAQLVLESPKSLVFIFAGPSGHGKTEVARGLGKLISTDMITIDCTTFRRENELFGPRPPYTGSQKGSPLNNFLASHSGRRGLVFMDEFEKTNQDIHNTLLIPFDQGEYLNRRDSIKIDCSKIIWILATNRFDDNIHKFYEINRCDLAKSQNDQKKVALTRQLVNDLKKECISYFGAPLAGRVSEIMPFLPFTPDEQAVIAYKAIMDLEAKLRQPVAVSQSGQIDNLVGNIRLSVDDDVRVSFAAANDSYMPQLGARSILRDVTDAIRLPLVSQYLKSEEDINDNQAEAQFKVVLNADNEIEVLRMKKRKH